MLPDALYPIIGLFVVAWGFTAVTKSFGERINKAGVGEYLKGYAWVNKHKEMILVHKYF